MDRRQFLAWSALLGGTATLGLSGCGSDGELVRADVSRARPDPAHLGEVVDAVGRFSLDLVREVGTEANLICSPLSVLVAFAMVRNGAVGKTAAEMDAAFHFPALAALNAGMNTIDQTLGKRSGKRGDDYRSGQVQVVLANAVWGQRDYVWGAPFLAALAADYGTGVHPTDFTQDVAARRAINRWVADQTHDKITDIATPDIINADTVLALVNALYLRAPWAEPFSSPSDRPFFTPGGRVSVPMIDNTLYRGYLSGRGWTGARIPLLGGELAVTVLRPDSTLGGLIETLAKTGLTTLLRKAPDSSVALSLPTFTVRSTIDLRPPLEALGMSTPFTGAAEFPGLTTTETLELQAAKHMGFIALNEEGVEAAAATIVSAEASSAQVIEHKVVIDRPFLYVVHDIELALPLLVGVVTDPR